jgi:agmatinase
MPTDHLADLLRLLEHTQGFIGSQGDYDDARAVILGAPMDYTTSFRPGTRLGPERIREVSYGLEMYSPYVDRSLEELTYYDAGDLRMPIGNVSMSLDLIERAAKVLYSDDKIPFVLGGEHLISWPVIKAAAEKYKDLHVIHFDAHADLRTEFFGEHNSHATVLRMVAEKLGDGRVFQFGIRSMVKEERVFARDHTRFYFNEVLGPLKQVLPEFKDHPVYITLDIDVLDPAYAPGTGTPEPGGCTPNDLFKSFELLKGIDLVGFDIVEVAPMLDLSQITALLGAKLLREALVTFM